MNSIENPFAQKNGLTPLPDFLRAAADFIKRTQHDDGCIPWFENGKCDPWDHIEAAMGLTVAGEFEAAKKAYYWLQQQQLPDGSWWANYQNNLPLDTDHRETNFIAYIATGLWHFYLASGDTSFLEDFFPTLEKAIDFVLHYQAHSGEIYWAVDQHGHAREDALVTACSSIYKSLTCALDIARHLHRTKPEWHRAQLRLHETLRKHPECFDRTWESKARYSMDWFYPILGGVLKPADANARLDQRWQEFMEPGVGCRCVSDEPWVTIAESSELTLALVAAGRIDQATELFEALQRWQDTDGAYWTGYNFRDDVIWPDEKTTWTAGAVLLAGDALFRFTKAANLFHLPDTARK